jgi:hypothetical protein
MAVVTEGVTGLSHQTGGITIINSHTTAYLHHHHHHQFSHYGLFTSPSSSIITLRLIYITIIITNLHKAYRAKDVANHKAFWVKNVAHLCSL